LPDNPTGSLPNPGGIGTLRWQVSLYRCDQAPDPNSPAISESLIRLGPDVHADIQPTYPGTFYLSAQIETPITHLIRMRWLDYIETVYVIMRSTFRPDPQVSTYRTEIFRVRRVKEVAGRKRFIELECELERVANTFTDSDEERLALFAENPVVVH
jgi:hypothetical protein